MAKRPLNPNYKKMLKERDAKRKERAQQKELRELKGVERTLLKQISFMKKRYGPGSSWTLEEQLQRIRNKINQIQGNPKPIKPKSPTRTEEKKTPKTQPKEPSLEIANSKDYWYKIAYSKGWYIPYEEFAENFTRMGRMSREYSSQELIEALKEELQKEYQLWGEELPSKNENGAWTDRKVENYFNHLRKNKSWAILHIFANADNFDDAVKQIADILRYKQIEGYLDPNHQKALFDRVQNIQLLDLSFSKDIAEELYKISPEALYNNKDDPKGVYKKVYRKHGKRYDSGYEELFKELPKPRRRGVPEPRPLHIDDHEDASWHELVINDIFKLCGIQFEFQINFPNYIKKWIVDYRINGRWFEVFGRNDERYAEEMKEKIEVIPRLLWVDVRKYSPGQKRIIKKYAEKLDKEICTSEGCGKSLFATSIIEILYRNIELIKEENIPLTESYKTYLEQISSKDIGRIRQKVDERIPETTDLRLTQAQIQDQGPISMEQINQELSQQYQSVQLWDDHEKIAVYFKTAQNLMTHMPQQNYQFQDYYQQPQENLRMVAHNWYKRMKY